jgi:hypothetical protein
VPAGNLANSPVLYASDYSAQQIHPLVGLEYPWAFSPDGTKMASFGPNNRVVIRNVDERWITAVTVPISSPTPPSSKE